MKHIEVEINSEGEVTMEVHGATGAECEQMTADLEKALGTTTKKLRKREYYQQTQRRDQQART